MPEISRFLGIVIAIYYREHGPLEWYNLHKDELSEDWRLAQGKKPLKKFAPLE